MFCDSLKFISIYMREKGRQSIIIEKKPLLALNE